LKSRRIDLSKYPTLFIGYDKLHNIKKNYLSTPVILLWCDTFNNVYYTYFNTNMLKNKVIFANDGKCFLINKCNCVSGMDNLLQELKQHASVF